MTLIANTQYVTWFGDMHWGAGRQFQELFAAGLDMSALGPQQMVVASRGRAADIARVPLYFRDRRLRGLYEANPRLPVGREAPPGVRHQM